MGRTLGILGGMSWVSTALYYRQINEHVARVRGRQHSAELLVASVDFQPIVDAQARADWQGAGELLAAKVLGLERAGAGAFLIASNTMHLVLASIKARVKIPALDIFDATAAAARRADSRRLGLLGTRYTMSHAFYRDEYAKRGIDVLIPDEADAKRVNEIIFRELIQGLVTEPSTSFYRDVVRRLASRGAEGVILGCTEIGLVLDPAKSDVPLFDTSYLHADEAARWLLETR